MSVERENTHDAKWAVTKRATVPPWSAPSSFAAPSGSVATPYELKSLGGKDYYICLRDTETPVAKILRGTLNKELIELKQCLDGKMPLNCQAHRRERE